MPRNRISGINVFIGVGAAMGLQQESSGGREQAQPHLAGNGIRATVDAGSVTGEQCCVIVPSAGPTSAGEA